MRITWKDGVTTLAAAGAIVLERAYFHSWDWPLVDSTRWVLAGLAVLGVIAYGASYLADHFNSQYWTLAAGLFALAGGTLTVLGMVFEASDYVVLMMLDVVVFWAVSLVRHVVVPSGMYHSTA